MAISKRSSEIKFDDDFLDQIRNLDRETRKKLGEAINDVQICWGSPHLHAGIGLRKVTKILFECRSGLKSRLIFEPLADGSLYFHFMGNHDQIQRFIKSRR